MYVTPIVTADESTDVPIRLDGYSRAPRKNTAPVCKRYCNVVPKRIFVPGETRRGGQITPIVYHIEPYVSPENVFERRRRLPFAAYRVPRYHVTRIASEISFKRYSDFRTKRAGQKPCHRSEGSNVPTDDDNTVNSGQNNGRGGSE